MTDRTTEALLARRELAEKATPGPWMPGTALDTGTVREGDGYILVDCRLTTSDGIANAAHIAANSPDVVMADIDEILRLREENGRLDREAEWLADKLKQYKGPSITYKGEIMSLREAARRALEPNCADQLAPEG